MPALTAGHFGYALSVRRFKGVPARTMTPNDKAKRRAGNMPAKKDDADRRVRLSAMFGGCRQRTAV
jgi:hypothetical protein